MNIVEEKLAEHLHTRAARSEVHFTVDDVMEGRHEIVVFEDAQVRRFRPARLVVGAVLVMAVGLLATVVLSSSGRTQLDSVPANPDGTTPTSSPTTTAGGVAEPTDPTTVESPIDETNSPTRTDPAQTSVGDTSEPDPATDPSPIIVTVTSAAPVGDVETTFSGVVAGIEDLTVERVEYDSVDGRCAEIVLTLDSGESGDIGECGRERPEPGRSLSEAVGSPGDVTLADRHFAIFDGKIATDTFARGTRIELNVYGLTTAVMPIGPDGRFFTVVELDAPIDTATVLANPLVWRAVAPDGTVLESYTVGRGSPAGG